MSPESALILLQAMRESTDRDAVRAGLYELHKQNPEDVRSIARELGVTTGLYSESKCIEEIMDRFDFEGEHKLTYKIKMDIVITDKHHKHNTPKISGDKIKPFSYDINVEILKPIDGMAQRYSYTYVGDSFTIKSGVTFDTYREAHRSAMQKMRSIHIEDYLDKLDFASVYESDDDTSLHNGWC